MSSIATGEGTANIVNGRCEALAAGGARLTITIGGESDSVIDDSGPTGFIGIGMFVRAEGGRTTARFDELTMRSSGLSTRRYRAGRRCEEAVGRRRLGSIA